MKETDFQILKRFFLNAFINAEISRTEIESFLQAYLNYIFEINHLDRSNYQITISTLAVDEFNRKREKSYKTQSNQESRRLIKRRVLTKPSYKSNCSQHYFDALMIPNPTNDKSFKILINKNLFHASNDDEIMHLVTLFNMFGHEVHHIIQYIKRPYEMDRYDYLQSIHDYYLKNAERFTSSKKEAKKLKNAIHRHMSLLYSTCKSEMYADKKGYDYFDILLNNILSTLPQPNSIEEDMFITFINCLQEENNKIFENRCYGSYIDNLKHSNSSNILSNYSVDADLLEID